MSHVLLPPPWFLFVVRFWAFLGKGGSAISKTNKKTGPEALVKNNLKTRTRHLAAQKRD
jgi:hypothetical protein